MAYLTGFQKDELDKASKYLDNCAIFDKANITDTVADILTQIKDLNTLAKISVAQLLHHLVKDQPIIAIDENDEWIEYPSKYESYDFYQCKRYPTLMKAVSKETGKTAYYDTMYYRSIGGVYSEAKEVTLPYLPPYERVVIPDATTMKEVVATMDPAQLHVVEELIRIATDKKNTEDETC